MSLRSSSLSWVCFIALFALGLYLLKYDVQAIHKQNLVLQKQIEDERLAMQLLEAEWVYLNRPERLQKLAEHYLKNMQPMTPQAVAGWADMPLRQPKDAAQMVSYQEVR